MKSSHISRRTVLRGLGTAVALPFLDAMLPKTLAQSSASIPRRMAFIYIPNGANMATWMPTTEGTGFALTPALAPMEAHRQDMIVFGGLTCDKANANGDGAGDHARAGGAFLTGAQPRKTSGANFQAGVSADQVAAARLGNRTRFPSLEMAIERFRGAGNCDSGYSCVYEHTMSWRSPTSPLPTETNPRQIFNRLFADEPQDPETAARNELRVSVLDAVLEDARDLNRRLGGNDRRQLDQYLSGVREVEQRISSAAQLSPITVPDDFSRPAGVPADLTDHIRLMCDLLVLAFQTDVTRIATFMIGREGSEQKYRMAGINEGHHTISHHQNRPANLAKLQAINTYHMQQLAYLTGKLTSIPEEGGTLLDHSMIAYGSAIADPNRHAHGDLPMILVGRGGNTIRTGRFVRYPRNTPLNNLWQAMLERFGVPAADARFGDGTRALEGLV